MSKIIVETPELLPCPFCGGKAMIDYDSGNEVWGQSWQARCTECNAKTVGYSGSSTWSPRTKAVRTGDREAVAKAIANWNRRVE